MRYTPQIIVGLKEFFSIPIYQRLFEWNEDNILTLLGDLYKAKMKGSKEYYIGLLTATEGTNELVDGQQRFIVMMLLGCVMQNYDERWKSFLYDGKMRIHFLSRPLDENYLRKAIDSLSDLDSSGYNIKFYRGIKCISTYLDSLNEDEKRSLATYVYENLCFFITKLPTNYNALDLNIFFERMNSSGKNLEPHEILKVKLLRHLKNDDFGRYMQLWNLIADVDTPIIRRRENENETELFKRKNIALSGAIPIIVAKGSEIITGMNSSDISDSRSIANIEAAPKLEVVNKRSSTETRCVLRFPHLLLQTLFWRLKGKIKGRLDDFFDASKLLETFEIYIPYERDDVSESEVLGFLQDLLHCRVALDVCFVRTMDYGFFLDMNKADENENVKSLLMLESMLYVSSSNLTNYEWFGWLMDSLLDNGLNIPDPQALFESLLMKCDSKHTLLPYSELTFNDRIRYWFWRLDLIIWLNRKTLFKDNPSALKVADNYVFTRNRSIEHIAPQHPKTESAMSWGDSLNDNNLCNSFGNLAMISQNINSALSNESYEVKREHVKAFINGSVTGSIESLKLLMAFNDYKIWSRESINDHGKKMYSLLQSTIM